MLPPAAPFQPAGPASPLWPTRHRLSRGIESVSDACITRVPCECAYCKFLIRIMPPRPVGASCSVEWNKTPQISDASGRDQLGPAVELRQGLCRRFGGQAHDNARHALVAIAPQPVGILGDP